MCDTGEVGFLTEPVTPVVSHLYEEEGRALLQRLLDSKITLGSLLIGLSFALEKSLRRLDAYLESVYICVYIVQSCYWSYPS